MAKKRSLPSVAKAKQILEEGKIGGKSITPAQRGLFGLIAQGKRPTRLKKRK